MSIIRNLQKGRRLSFVVRRLCRRRPSVRRLSSVVGRRRPSSSVVRRRPSSSVVVRRRCATKLYKGFAFQKQRPFSQGGPNIGNTTVTTSTATAGRKGDPQHMSREKTYKDKNIIVFE